MEPVSTAPYDMYIIIRIALRQPIVGIYLQSSLFVLLFYNLLYNAIVHIGRYDYMSYYYTGVPIIRIMCNRLRRFRIRISIMNAPKNYILQ